MVLERLSWRMTCTNDACSSCMFKQKDTEKEREQGVEDWGGVGGGGGAGWVSITSHLTQEADLQSKVSGGQAKNRAFFVLLLE